MYWPIYMSTYWSREETPHLGKIVKRATPNGIDIECGLKKYIISYTRRRMFVLIKKHYLSCTNIVHCLIFSIIEELTSERNDEYESRQHNARECCRQGHWLHVESSLTSRVVLTIAKSNHIMCTVNRNLNKSNDWSPRVCQLNSF